VDAHVLTWAGKGVRSALIVVPASGAATLDGQVADRLRGLGLEVTTISQAALTATAVLARTLVVVMPGVDGATVKPSLLTAHAPVLVLEPTALDDLGMVGTVANTDFGTAANANEIAVTQPTHPLAAGLSGLAWVYSSAGSLGWGKPAATATTVATVVGQSTQSTILGYLTGTQMVGQVATARRAGLFMTRTVGDGVSSVGWQFFDAAVKWLATPEVLLIVADSTALNASDTAIKALSEMPEARHSMLLSDARQTSPLPANAPLPHRSVCPPDLDLRQVPRASEGRGHQLESSSNLGSSWHP
jgi:hypothetical protein